MNLVLKRFPVIATPFTILVLLSSVLAFGQSELKSAIPTATPESDVASAGAVAESPKETSKKGDKDSKSAPEVEELRKRVDDLQSIVDQQQKALADMQHQLAKLASLPGAVKSTNTVGDNSAPVVGTAVASAAPASGSPAPSPGLQKEARPLAGWDGNHAFLRSADGNFETDLTGYAQLDFRGYESGNHPPNTFVLRRARMAFEGKLFKYFDFKVEGDVADTASTILRDVYVRVHRVDQIQATFGHFKEPFSQEELRSDTVQDFVERSLANFLAPSRSPGAMISGVLDKGVFEYQVGAFNGKGTLALNTVGTPEGVVRVRFAPWKNGDEFWTKGFSFGGAYAIGRNAINAQGIRGQTESRSTTFFNPDTVNGPIVRANGELTWLLGPAAIRAEYDQINQARNDLGPHGTTLPGVVSKGFAGQFTYLLTGEAKPDVSAVVPKHNVFSNENGSPGHGAWELKFRYSSLQMSDSTAKSNRANSIYFGANWYLSKFVRYVLDLGIEQFNDPVRSPRPGSHDFFVVLSRVQVAF